MKSLSRVRLFATPWAVACTRLLCAWDFLGKSTGVGCHFLLQGIFLTQGSNPGLPHCGQTLYHPSHQGSPFKSTLGKIYFGKESFCSARDLGSIPGSGRSPGAGNGSSHQYSCLENYMDRGTWQGTVHGGRTESDMTEELTHT